MPPRDVFNTFAFDNGWVAHSIANELDRVRWHTARGEDGLEHYTPCIGCGAGEAAALDDGELYRSRTGNVCSTCVDGGTYRVCSCCSDCALADTLEQVHDAWVCARCVPTEVAECGSCTSRMVRGRGTRVATGISVCVTCARTHYIRCHGCSQLVHRSTLHDLNDRWAPTCVSCYEDQVTCYSCGDRIQGSDAHEGNGELWCGRCHEQSFRECSSCSESVHVNDAIRLQIRGRTRSYCETCANDFDRCRQCDAIVTDEGCQCAGGGAIIHPYNWRPTVKFFCQPHEMKVPVAQRLHFGFELEMESGRRSDQPALLERLKTEWSYFKADGSLSNGFEWVTHPFTWAWFGEHRADIEERLRAASSAGYRSYNTTTCGLHVHMSKSAFTSFHLFKFMALVYQNDEFTTLLSQRVSEGEFNQEPYLHKYASLSAENLNTKNLIRKARRRSRNPTGEKYVAVNVMPPHTVELRFFRGTLHPPSFFKALEYARAAYDFSAVTAVGNLTDAHFSEWVFKNRKQFPNLHAFISTRGADAQRDA